MFANGATRVVFVFLLLVMGDALIPATAQTSPVEAQVPQRILLPVDDAVRVKVPKSTHPLAVPAHDAGPLDSTTVLNRMVLVLKSSPDQEYQARTMLDSQQTRGSPNYHRWLTPGEFGREFGPSPQDIAQVTGWLQRQGFAVGSVAKSRRWIEFSGTSAQVEAAFQTHMRQYLVEGELHVANAADISIPAALAPVVHGVLSLHNFYSKPAMRPTETMGPVTWDRSQPSMTTGNGDHFITPGDLATIYDLNPLYTSATPVNTINGSGQVIAIAAAGNINLSDVSAFQSIFGLPKNPPNIILNGPDPGITFASPEASLDVEYAGAIAPAATIDLVVSGGTHTTDPVALSSSFIVDQNLAPIMNMSFRACGEGVAPNPFWTALWEQAAAQGISVFVSSGDTGAGCGLRVSGVLGATSLGVNPFASTPFDTAVGGTEFNETVNGGVATTFWNSSSGPNLASALGYIPEKVWNDSFVAITEVGIQISLASGGGGVSTIYGAPSYQTLPIQGLAGAGYPNRPLPDVSLVAANAHDPYVYCFSTPTQPDCQSSNNQVTFNNLAGGTSFSSAEFAGIMALVNQAVGSPQGLANYGLYSLAAAESASFSSCNSSNQTDPSSPPGPQCVFNDITAGNNGVPGVDFVAGFVPPGDTLGQLGYNAIAGFDPASGLGSVNAATLVNAWVALAKGFQGSQTTLSASFNGTPLPSNSVTITHGQPVSVTVQVARQGTTGTPSGNVSVLAQGGNLPSPSVGIAGEAITGSNGTATAGPANLNNLPGGTNYNLLASFPGDGVFAGSTSNAINVTVGPEDTTTSLQSFAVECIIGNQPPNCLRIADGATSMNYGDSLLLAIDAKTVGLSGQTPASGNATYAIDGTPMVTRPVDSSGIAEVYLCRPPFTACPLPGQHTVTATYSGDGPLSYNGSSSSSPLNITINKGNPFPKILAPAKVGLGSAFTLGTQVLTGVGTIAPTGTAQFFDVPFLPNGPPPTPLGGPLTLSGGQASTQVTINASGLYGLGVTYSGDDTYNTATEEFVDIQVGVPFLFTATTPPQTITAGGTATYSLTLSTDPGFPGYSGQIAFTCAGAPGGSTCTVTPNSASLFDTTTSVPLTVTVSNTANAQLGPSPWKNLPLGFCGLMAVVVVWFKRKPGARVRMLLTVFLIVGLISCGGGSGPHPPPTNATLTVTGSDSVNHQSNSITLSLTITH